jgi:hypothetical protein
LRRLDQSYFHIRRPVNPVQRWRSGAATTARGLRLAPIPLTGPMKRIFASPIGQIR